MSHSGSSRVLHRRPVRQILKRANLSGSFVVGKYRFSPYMACEHGCAYCDGRAERYYVEGSFDRDIVVRENAPERLAEELAKQRERGFVSLGSGVSDVYQPVEEELELTRRCLEVLAAHPFPVTVMAKSHLALRDLNLLRTLASGPGCMVIVSLTFADDSLRAGFQPGASSVEDRIELLRACSSAGCHIGVLAMPLLPRISDTDEQVEALFEQLLPLSPDFVMPAGLTLRPGAQKEFFFDTQALDGGRRRYIRWLGERKRWYNRHRSMSYEELDAELRTSTMNGTLASVLENQRLARFVSEIVEAGCVFDYGSLSWCRPATIRRYGSSFAVSGVFSTPHVSRQSR